MAVTGGTVAPESGVELKPRGWFQFVPASHPDVIGVRRGRGERRNIVTGRSIELGEILSRILALIEHLIQAHVHDPLASILSVLFQRDRTRWGPVEGVR